MMYSATIHQPYFLPWIGYFSKLIHSDYFIVLDDVMYRDWFFHKRAVIKNMNKVEQKLSLPVGHNHKTPLSEVKIPKDKALIFFRKMANTMIHTYSKQPFFKEEWSAFASVFESTIATKIYLVDINIELIRYFMTIFEISHVKMEKSSEIAKGKSFENPTDRIVYLCEKKKINQVITGVGGSDKVHDKDCLHRQKICFLKQDFNTAFGSISGKYPNVIPTYSVIDSLFKNGRAMITKLLKEDVFIPQREIQT